MKIYLSKHFLTCALTFSKKEECVGVKQQAENKIGEKKENGFLNWKLNLKNNEYEIIAKAILNTKIFQTHYIKESQNKEYFDKYFFNFIKNNPDINFYLIIPTYSRLAYRIKISVEYPNQDNILFYTYKTNLKWLIKETSKYPNVKIYGFDNLKFADDLNNYRDPFHYDSKLNSMQLDVIKNQKNILTPQNMDEYFKIMEEKIRNYNLTPFVEFIKKQKN